MKSNGFCRMPRVQGFSRFSQYHEGLQKYPAYGSLQKDIAEPWPVDGGCLSIRESFDPLIPSQIMWTKTEVDEWDKMLWLCQCDLFYSALCLPDRPSPEEYAGVKTEEVLFTNGSDQGRISRECFSFSRARALVLNGWVASTFHPKKIAVRDRWVWDSLRMKLQNLSPCDKGIDLVVRCCCEKGSEVADLAEVLTPGDRASTMRWMTQFLILLVSGNQMFVNMLSQCNESASTSVFNHTSMKVPLSWYLVEFLGVFYQHFRSPSFAPPTWKVIIPSPTFAMFEQAAESEGLVIRRPNFTKEMLGRRVDRIGGLLIGIMKKWLGCRWSLWWFVSNQTCMAPVCCVDHQWCLALKKHDLCQVVDFEEHFLWCLYLDFENHQSVKKVCFVEGSDLFLLISFLLFQRRCQSIDLVMDWWLEWLDGNGNGIWNPRASWFLLGYGLRTGFPLAEALLTRELVELALAVQCFVACFLFVSCWISLDESFVMIYDGSEEKLVFSSQSMRGCGKFVKVSYFFLPVLSDRQPGSTIEVWQWSMSCPSNFASFVVTYVLQVT